MDQFESLGLKSGIWQGVLRREAPPGRLLLVHMGTRVGMPAPPRRTMAPGASLRRSRSRSYRMGCRPSCCWKIRAKAPSRRRPAPGICPASASSRASLVEEDMRAEMNLMRSELDLLKKELRRLAAN